LNKYSKQNSILKCRAIKHIKQPSAMILFYKKCQIIIGLNLPSPKYITPPIGALSSLSVSSQTFYFQII
jgi:hypothetical protein